MNDLIDIEGILNEWSNEQWEVAHRRAEHLTGMERDMDDETYTDELKTQCAKQVLDKAFPELVKDGYLDVVGISAEGEIQYSPTAKAEAWHRERLKSE